MTKPAKKSMFAKKSVNDRKMIAKNNLNYSQVLIRCSKTAFFKLGGAQNQVRLLFKINY